MTARHLHLVSHNSRLILPRGSPKPSPMNWPIVNSLILLELYASAWRSLCLGIRASPAAPRATSRTLSNVVPIPARQQGAEEKQFA